ncbi:MAG: ABC transporter permease [Chloroflexota bacterium]
MSQHLSETPFLVAHRTWLRYIFLATTLLTVALMVVIPLGKVLISWFVPLQGVLVLSLLALYTAHSASLDWLRGLVLPALAVFTALVLGGLAVAFTDRQVWAALSDLFTRPGPALKAVWDSMAAAYSALFQGSIGNLGDVSRGLQAWWVDGDTKLILSASRPLTECLVLSVPYILSGLAVALGFRTGLFNIGVEGQFVIGGLCAVVVGYQIAGLPAIVHLPLSLLAGMAGGGLWAALPGYLKAKTGAHEVINTIMLNWVAFRLVEWLLKEPLEVSQGTHRTPDILPTAELPRFFPHPIRLHAGFVLALLVAALVYWFLFKTVWGFELRTVGANPDAARYGGMNITRNFVLAMALSGALAGLAGATESLGVTRNMTLGFSAGYGFDSIALALLGKSHPLGVVLAGILFGTLRAGGKRMQSVAGIPLEIITIMQAMVIVFIAAPAIVRAIYRIKAARDEGKAVFTRGWGS